MKNREQKDRIIAHGNCLLARSGDSRPYDTMRTNDKEPLTAGSLIALEFPAHT